MRKVTLFVEDHGHEQIVGALLSRLARENHVKVRLDWRNATGGHGAVIKKAQKYLRDLKQQRDLRPDLIVVATDANCSGLNARTQELEELQSSTQTVFAIPDPHIERWLLLDGAAFKKVFGKGCDAPDQKCSRDLYKQRLAEAVRATGVDPIISGIEHAEDIINAMDIDRASHADRSFGRFVRDIRDIFGKWRRQGKAR